MSSIYYKNPLGTTILRNSAIFAIEYDRRIARVLEEKARKLWPSMKILTLDLSNPKEKIIAIDLDPDLADLKEGVIIAIIWPDSPND